MSFQTATPLEIIGRALLAAFCASVALIHTLGALPGALPWVARPLAVIVCGLTLLLVAALTLEIKKILGKSAVLAVLLTWGMLAFWTWFRAPVDVDGLFYHLTLVLDAWQREAWGNWSFPHWQMRNAPHFADSANLLWLSIGGPLGYRTEGFGQWTSVWLGAWGAWRCALALGWKRPIEAAFGFLLMPLVIKQAGSHYVDIAGWSFWICAASVLLEKKPGRIWIGCAAIFLHVGTKMSGPLTALPLLALIPLWGKPHRRVLLFWGGISVVAGVLPWMLPNFLHTGNPIYPLDPRSLLGLNPGQFIPHALLVESDLHGAGVAIGGPRWIQWILNMMIPEPVAVYDINGGAWGLLAPLGTLFLLIRGRTIYFGFKRLPAELQRSILCLLLASVTAFILMPGRMVPRHGFIGGLLIVSIGWISISTLGSARWKKAAHIALALQVLHALPDRTALRGMSLIDWRDTPSVFVANLSDIIRYGEPKTPGRWMHTPVLPSIRALEPRLVWVGEDTIDFPAVYWGRHFLNRVEILPSVWTQYRMTSGLY